MDGVAVRMERRGKGIHDRNRIHTKRLLHDISMPNTSTPRSVEWCLGQTGTEDV